MQFFISNFLLRLKVNHTLQLYGGCQRKGGDELEVMFADVLGRTVNRNLGVKFHLLNYFLGLIFFLINVCIICMFKRIIKGISKENTYLLFTESVDKCTYVFVCLKKKRKSYTMTTQV